MFSASSAFEYKNRFLSVPSVNPRLPESRGCYTCVFVRVDECKICLCYFVARNFEVHFHCRGWGSVVVKALRY